MNKIENLEKQRKTMHEENLVSKSIDDQIGREENRIMDTGLHNVPQVGLTFLQNKIRKTRVLLTIGLHD